MVRGGDGRNRPTVMEWQARVCAALVVVVLLIRLFWPGGLAGLRDLYARCFEKEEPQGPLLRFAQAAVEDIFLTAEAAAPKAAPAGYSLNTWTPDGLLYAAPLAAYKRSSPYGWRVHPISGAYAFHGGIDLAADEGTPVLAAMAGIVQRTGYDSVSGNYVVLLHGQGAATTYCHMQYIFVRAGELVPLGQCLGTVGQTGGATGPHLHFVLKRDDIRYDPAALLEPAP